MKTFWCLNGKTGEIFCYNEYEDNTTNFNRGTLLAYGDYLVTGIKTKEDAVKISSKYRACNTCKSTMLHNDGKCFYCGKDVPVIKLKEVQ